MTTSQDLADASVSSKAIAHIAHSSVKNMAGTATTSIKMLQSKQSVSMLLVSSDKTEYTELNIPVSNWLQALDRCNAECLFRAHKQRDATSKYAEHFNEKVFVNCGDAHAANFREVTALLQGHYGPDWTDISIVCKQHRTATAKDTGTSTLRSLSLRTFELSSLTLHVQLDLV